MGCRVPSYGVVVSSAICRWVRGGGSTDDAEGQLKRFACRDVIPGCGGVFTGAGDQGVLDQVLAHVAADHGLVRPPLPFIESVMAHTHPFVPTSNGHHPQVVNVPDAGRRVDTTDPRRPGNQFTLGDRDARVTAPSSAVTVSYTHLTLPTILLV